MRFWIIVGLAALLLVLPVIVQAQGDSRIQCGDTVSGEFDAGDDEVDFYIDLNAGDILVLSGSSSSAQFVIQLQAPPDWTNRLGESAPLSLTPTLTTVAVPSQGTYNVEADNNKDGVSGGTGAFSLQVSCQQAQGDSHIQCGETVSGEFDADDDEVDFFIDLSAGDILVLSGNSLSAAQFVIQFQAPPDWTNRLGESAPLSLTPALTTVSAPSQGTYNIEADNNKDGVSGGTGRFRLRIGCLVHDGETLILPYQQQGDFLVLTAGGTEAGGGNRASVLRLPDTSNLARVPITPNSPMNGTIPPNGSVAVGYTFETTSPQTLELNLTQAYGNLNLGVVVMSDLGFLYQGGLIGAPPQTIEMQVELPEAGRYTIVIYHINLLPPATPEETGYTLNWTLR